MLYFSLLILIINLAFTYSNTEYPSVKTPLGKIRGYYKISENGNLYEAYEGIPYARPPIGKLRFRPPEKISPWVGELQATKVSDGCLQYSHLPTNKNERVEGSEDCLYLNVYVPIQKGKKTPIPVIFWIHGGCFQYGYGTVYGAKYLVDKDVILVTINYRLGPLGFLSTENEIVSGNMGLKDQNMALKWVHENIEWFGGDPKKVTLTGLSAGGASVHYHYLSPLSTGLFQNGISFSGTSLLCWAQTEKSLEKAKKLGAIMGCPTDNIKDMIECLRNRPAKPLVQATSEFMPWIYNPYTPFGPVVEKSNKDYFINRSPIDIITSGDVQDLPWFTGVVSEEGLYPVAEFGLDKTRMKYLDDNWDLVATHLLDYNYTLPKNKHKEVAKKIRKHYFGSKPIDRLNLKSLTLLTGDRLFVVDAEKAARMQAKANESPVWFYYYSYRAAQSLSDTMSGTKENIGVCHADDTYLVIEQPFINPRTTEEDKAMQKDLLNFWTSIAYNGKPDFGIEWPQVNPTKKELNYLHISGPGKFSIEYNDNLGEKKLWSSINFDENNVKRGLKDAKEEL
ncbi:carboxylic ester hydrolase-like [Phymastichus coffea]|uniref:carboxylic ester hydrolase-like n=1 Tax=Phymastichus coffea TaxID=108790 RepID=UPI00273AAB9A|nr:carboxylic ester hydrolase-like [Phymastichus coffea]